MKTPCEHCQCQTESGEDCPQCGAEVVTLDDTQQTQIQADALAEAQAEQAYELAAASRRAARDAAELAACQRLLPLLQPEHLAALARNANARGISTADVSAIGLLSQAENCVSLSAEKALAPVAKKFNLLLKEEQEKAGLKALDKALEEANAAVQAARALQGNAEARHKRDAELRESIASASSNGFGEDAIYHH